MANGSKAEQAVASGRYSLFQPSNKGNLLSDFPELRKVQSFMDIDNPRKMLFVWYYACKVSPARDILDDTDRIKFAMAKAWDGRVPKEIEGPYLKRAWGDEIAQAIADMSAYEPELRIRLKITCAQHIEILEGLISQKPKDGEWGNMLEYLKVVQQSLATVKEFMPLAEGKALGVTAVTDAEQDDSTIFDLVANRRN